MKTLKPDFFFFSNISPYLSNIPELTNHIEYDKSNYLKIYDKLEIS